MSCQQNELRITTEKTGAPNGAPAMMSPQGSSMPMGSLPNTDASQIDSSIIWELPGLWTAVRGSGIRMATFHTPEDTAAQITLTFLPGPSGELVANLRRWMKQANIQLSTDEFSSFIKSSKNIENQQGWSGRIFDFSQCASPAGFIVVQFMRPQGNYFVKLTTSLSSAQALRPKLIELAQSLRDRP